MGEKLENKFTEDASSFFSFGISLWKVFEFNNFTRKSVIFTILKMNLKATLRESIYLFFVGQFCLYCSLLVGLALELFDIPCCACACACVRTVVIKQKAIIEV